MNGSFIDAKVLLDIATADPNWMAWLQEQLRAAAVRGMVYVNPIIYAELAPAFNSKEELDRFLDPSFFRRAPLPYDAGWVAAQAFIKYRRGGGLRSAPLPDFYVGAHAEIEGLTLISRDAARYKTYFPSVELVAPST